MLAHSLDLFQKKADEPGKTIDNKMKVAYTQFFEFNSFIVQPKFITMSVIDPALKIYVEQLRGGKTQQLSEAISPEFLGVQEPELAFHSPVVIEGEAYLAQDDLVIQVDLQTQAQIPCRVCNELFQYDISIQKLMHIEPITDLKRGYFDISEVLREAILLEIPVIAECHDGHCPARKDMEGYLKQSVEEEEVEEGYHPFEGLSLDDQDKEKRRKK